MMDGIEVGRVHQEGTAEIQKMIIGRVLVRGYGR
jgi:hypothetical protein